MFLWKPRGRYLIFGSRLRCVLKNGAASGQCQCRRVTLDAESPTRIYSFCCSRLLVFFGFLFGFGKSEDFQHHCSSTTTNFCSREASTMVDPPSESTLRIFLSGDVMLGRGVDQILEYHVNPVLHEGYVTNAKTYVELAEAVNGPLPENRTNQYVWGDAIEIFDKVRPDIRVINLETSITSRGQPWPGKGIHYRMHPGNVPVISSAGVQCCILSNNHVLDWHYEGFTDTLQALSGASIKTVGAGQNITEARKPAIFDVPGKSCRLLIFGAGSPSAGVFVGWKATDKQMGVNVVSESSDDIGKEISKIKDTISTYRRASNDLVVYSIHWGSNWNFDLERGQKEFAHRLIDEAGVDVVHGHSSHHVKGLEIYKNKLILYGCGDLLTDYEGIQNEDYKSFRDDVSFLYFVDLDCSTGDLENLFLAPMRLKRMQIRRAVGEDEQYLFDTMKRELSRFNKGDGNVTLERCHDNQFFKLVF